MPSRKRTPQQKAAKRKYDAKWHKRNRRKNLKIMARWYKKNIEKKRRYNSDHHPKYYKKNLKRFRLYYRKNRKRICRQSAAYYKKYLKTGYFEKYRKTLAARYAKMTCRHKRQLVPRGIIGKPMSLSDYLQKLYFVDGRERRCYYCHGENNKTGSGLDRLDNNITYTVKNTVPCCRGCNSWRGSTHTVQETRNHFKPMRGAARKKNA